MKKIIVSITVEEDNEDKTQRWQTRQWQDRFTVENIKSTDDIGIVCEEVQVAAYNLTQDLLEATGHGG